MPLGEGEDGAGFTTGRLAELADYSVQQIRDLERLGVIPPSERRANGYRRFGADHLAALRAYRGLAVAIGPVAARATMRELPGLSHAAAVARIVDLHVGLARSRDEARAALTALDSIMAESQAEAPALASDAMSITELSAALGVRSSALRYWEREGLLAPERTGGPGTRRYPPESVREARIVTALRAGGHRIPAVRSVMEALRAHAGAGELRAALQDRLEAIAASSRALLRAGGDLAAILDTREPAALTPG